MMRDVIDRIHIFFNGELFRMKKHQTVLTCFAVLVTLAAVVGCSGGSKSLGSSVTGAVTVNGSPAPAGLEISFQPVGDGAPSFGTTNSEGKYSLQMTPRLKGASPGENLVSVTMPVMEYAEGEEETAEETPSFKILKEFRDGTHKVTVSKGQNTIDLEIAAE